MPTYKNIGKIGLGIVAFEGTEHLYNIISELRKPKLNGKKNEEYDLVDAVVICLQEIGYDDNKKISNVDLNECIRLRDEDKLVDEIMFANLDTTKKAREQETDKRNFIIDKLKNDYGCDYVIIIDSDEFYTHSSFQRACELIDKEKYPITYCEYCNYFGLYNTDFKDYSYRMLMKYPFSDGMFVPFLIKSDYKFKFESTDFNRPSDPTRRVSIPVKDYEIVEKEGKKYKKPIYEVNYFCIPWEVCKMHHLSWLRADIRKKLESWSSKKLFQNYDDLIDRAVKHFKTFNPTNPDPKALMLFNTPGNSVDISILDREYIKPQVDYRTRLRPAKDYKKLLVLSMSADVEPFNTLERASKLTWMNIDKNKFPNIDVDFWVYTDAAPGEETHVDEENKKIYIKRDTTKENLYEATFSKTVEAFKIILDDLKLDFDWLIRTNNSTWLNIPLINEILAYNHDDSIIYCGNLYAAFWSAFNLYGGGNLIIFSKRQMNINKKIFGTVEQAKAYESKIVSCDDNMMCGLINNRIIKLGLTYDEIYQTIGCQDRYRNEKYNDVSDVDFSYPGYQVKTYPNEKETVNRLEADIVKMLAIDKKWRENKKPIDEIYNLWQEKHFNKDIIILKETKKEWFALEPDYASTLRLKDENKMPREEALKFLKEHQTKCGYSPGNFF